MTLTAEHCPPRWVCVVVIMSSVNMWRVKVVHPIGRFSLAKNKLQQATKLVGLKNLNLGTTGIARSLEKRQTQSILTDTVNLFPTASSIDVVARAPVASGSELLKGVREWFSDRVLFPADGVGEKYRKEKIRKAPVMKWIALQQFVDLKVFDETTGSGRVQSEELATISNSASENTGNISWIDGPAGSGELTLS